ncbi:MAG: hypothetical protein WCQ50_07505 [Spirochaetota bacterium]
MSLKRKLPFLPALFALAAGLLAFAWPQSNSDPLLGLAAALRKPLTSYREPLILQAPQDEGLAPSRLALDLLTLAEFGALSISIEVPIDWTAGNSTSTSTIDRLRASIGVEFDLVSGNLDGFWQGLRSGSLRPVDATASFGALKGLVLASRNRLVEEATPSSDGIDNLVSSLKLTDPTWLGLRPRSGSADMTAQGTRSAASFASHLPTSFTFSEPPEFPSIATFEPLPTTVEEALSVAGFVGQPTSTGALADGVPLASFLPLARDGERFVPNSALMVLVRRLDARQLSVGDAGILLKEASLPRQGRRELLIPLDRGGRAWFDREEAGGQNPDGSQGESSTRRLELEALREYRLAEASAYEALRAIERSGYLVERSLPSSEWARAQAMGSRVLPGSAEQLSLTEWKAAKAAAIEAARAALDEKIRIDTMCIGLLSLESMSEESKLGVQGLKDRADAAFDAAAKALDELAARKQALTEAVGASLCLIADRPTASVDGFVGKPGTPAFDPAREAADFIRAGLSGRFVSFAPRGDLALIGCLLGLALSLLLLLLPDWVAALIGLGLALALGAAAILAFVNIGIWYGPLMPAAAAILPGLSAGI